MTFQKKSIIITGGASGIGLGLTRSFAAQGHHISVLDINEANGIAVIASLTSEFPEASFKFKQCDVSSWESQAAAFAEVFSERGRIDIVIANAGMSRESKLVVDEDIPSKPDLRIVDINLVGTIYTVKLAIHYMRKNQLTATSSVRGSIVCLASIAGIYAFPVAPMYAATKSGIVGLVRSMARSLQLQQIQINALAPTVLRTNIAPLQELFDDMFLTPMSSLTKAVDEILNDETLTGQVVEVHGDIIQVREQPPFLHEETEKNVEHFWALGYA